MGIALPENHIKIGEKLCAFISEYKNKKYLNIRTMYEDRDTNELCMGKGLTIFPSEFPYLVEAVEDIEEMIKNAGE